MRATVAPGRFLSRHFRPHLGMECLQSGKPPMIYYVLARITRPNPNSTSKLAMTYYMITNRNETPSGFGRDKAELTYWKCDGDPLKKKDWEPINGIKELKTILVGAASKFPLLDAEDNINQKHVTLFIHGYNNSWSDSTHRYQKIANDIFATEDLGICVLFSWPSDGMELGYLPDREEARRCAGDLAYILSELYDWLDKKQKEGAATPSKACRAKTSVIAHSMGNYLLQNAAQVVWTRKNQPLLISLINQLVMVAADVDNDLFKSGESLDKSDGDALANLCYRITALYTGRDNVLGMSAGLKHFGKRRLGRSGLDKDYPTPDNVTEIDCSQIIPNDAKNIHSSYFNHEKPMSLIGDILRGMDRNIVREKHLPKVVTAVSGH